MADEMVEGVEPTVPPMTGVTAPEPEEMDDASAKKWRARIAKARTYTRDFIDEWTENVDYRRGKPYAQDSDQDRVPVNTDWPNTKAKHAQLFSQVPQVRLTTKLEPLKQAIPVFARKVNETLIEAGIESAMDEVMADVINASGIAAIVTRYETRKDMTTVPTVARSMVPNLSDEDWQYALDNEIIEQETVERITDQRFICERISPAYLVWAREFKLSDFEKSPWVGYGGRLTWPDAKQRFRLTDDQEKDARGTITDTKIHETKVSEDPDADEMEATPVEFWEIYYRRHFYHADEPSYDAIHRLVFVGGIEKPVIDEPWKGQEWNQQTGKYVGSCKYPIQFLTLTYLSDEAVPPSDTAIARPQTDELMASRTDMMLQRRHSRPWRWMDTTKVDALIQDAIQKGTYQGFIPTNGNGEKIMGEVARAQYPTENFSFDRVVKEDLMNSWQIGANQSGNISAGETSASEAQIVQANFQTRIGKERALVGKFFVRVAEVMAGLIALHGTFELPEFTPEEIQRIGTWDRKMVSNKFAYDIRKDSTVLLDAKQEDDRLAKFINDNVQSGYLVPEPLLRKRAELNGLDPDVVIRTPQPKQPEQPNLSLRFGGIEDVMNPIVLGLMMKYGYAPTPEELQMAMAMIMETGGMPSLVPNPTGPATTTGQPGATPQGAGGPSQVGGPTPVGEEHPDWHPMPRVNSRRSQEEESGE